MVIFYLLTFFKDTQKPNTNPNDNSFDIRDDKLRIIPKSSLIYKFKKKDLFLSRKKSKIIQNKCKNIKIKLEFKEIIYYLELV